MIAGDEVDAAQLLHLQPPPRRAEIERQPLQRDDAVAQAVQMRVAPVAGAGHVVDQEHGDRRARRRTASAPAPDGGSAAGPAPAGASPTGCRTRRERASTRSTSAWISLTVSPSSISQGWRIDWSRPPPSTSSTALSSNTSKSSMRPAVRAGDDRQLLRGLGQGDVERRVRRARTPSRRNCSASVVLPEPGCAFEQVEPVGGKAAAQDQVEALVTGRDLPYHARHTAPVARRKLPVTRRIGTAMGRTANRRRQTLPFGVPLVTGTSHVDAVAGVRTTIVRCAIAC